MTEVGITTRRINVVDDDRRLAALICRKLERLGYTSISDTPIPAAIDQADVWLVDLSVLTTLTGDLPPANCLIVMTGRDINQLPAPLDRCQILLKPFDETRLVAALHAVDRAKSR